jgi:hypothetical protein
MGTREMMLEQLLHLQRKRLSHVRRSRDWACMLMLMGLLRV